MGGVRYVDLSGSGRLELERTGAARQLVSFQFNGHCGLRFVRFLDLTRYGHGWSLKTVYIHHSAFSQGTVIY